MDVVILIMSGFIIKGVAWTDIVAADKFMFPPYRFKQIDWQTVNKVIDYIKKKSYKFKILWTRSNWAKNPGTPRSSYTLYQQPKSAGKIH